MPPSQGKVKVKLAIPSPIPKNPLKRAQIPSHALFVHATGLTYDFVCCVLSSAFRPKTQSEFLEPPLLTHGPCRHPMKRYATRKQMYYCSAACGSASSILKWCLSAFRILLLISFGSSSFEASHAPSPKSSFTLSQKPINTSLRPSENGYISSPRLCRSVCRTDPCQSHPPEADRLSEPWQSDRFPDKHLWVQFVIELHFQSNRFGQTEPVAYHHQNKRLSKSIQTRVLGIEIFLVIILVFLHKFVKNEKF
jgi:hypothetical protein